MSTPVFVCRLAKDLQNAIRNHAVNQGMAVGDVIGEALLSRGAVSQDRIDIGAIRGGSAPVFSCRMAFALQVEVRQCARVQGITVTAVVTAAVESFLTTCGGGLDIRPRAHLHQKGSDQVDDLFVIEGLDAA